MTLSVSTQPAALLCCALALLIATGPITALAQTTSTVTVNAANSLAVIPATGVGLNTAVWDANLLDSDVPSLLSAAGIGALRFPGGSTADDYNWQTDSIVTGQGGYANPANTFDAFMGVAKAVGAVPVITVNYGSSTSGNGGGTPAFAASWVQYANVTKGYGIKYWEIGNEVYGNGEYGSAWETDLHSAHDPATYGANVASFAAAMKAVDPTIKVGVVLTAPGYWPDGQSPNWNTNVLAQCATAIDFVIVHWYPQNPGSESDANLLAAPHSGIGGGPGIPAMMSKVKALISQYAGSNAANIQVFVTEMNSVSYDPGKQTVGVVNALFIADGITTWLENGVANVDVWDLHNGSTNGNTSSSLFGSATFGDYGILSNASSGEPALDTPFPTYYGMQMLASLGKPGDKLVTTGSSNSLLSTHAALRANGDLTLLLVNKDPTNTTTANVAVSGFVPASTGTVQTYGKTSSAITSSGASGLGSSFSIAAAPYSLTTVVLTPATSGAPASYTLAANPGTLMLAQGASISSTITVAPSGGFTGSVGFTASGLPSGVTATFNPTTTTGITTLTLTASGSASVGASTVTIKGTSGALSATTSVALTIKAATVAPQPSFSLALNPRTESVAQGGSIQSVVTVSPAGGFSGGVALSASGVPAGVTATFSPATTTSSSTLALAAGSTAAPGVSNITINGVSGSLKASVTLPLTVSAAATGGGPATLTGKSSSSSPWFDEEDVELTTTAPITALTLTITVAAGNVTYGGQYDTIGGQIVTSHASGSTIVYSYALTSGKSIGPGSYTFAAQMDGNGTQHSASGDSWTVTYVSGGATYSQSGAL
jgi:hypothetical protein